MKKNGNMTRKENFLSIMKALKSRTTLTKPNIAELTGLSSVTVNSAVNILIDANIVIEQGIASSNGGRKAALFSFNDQIFRIIGVNLYFDRIIVSLFDLRVNILKSNTVNIDVDSLLIEECIHRISDMVHVLLTETNTDKEHLLGIGIAIPGTVDYDKTIVYNVPALEKWRNIPLKEMLENELQVRVYLENDANCEMLALKWKNIIHESANCVYLSTKNGFGARIMLGGIIFRGNEGVSGEVGHVSVDPNGLPCKCGNRGCLELYVSDDAILKNTIHVIGEEHSGLLYEMCRHKLENIDFEMVVEAYKLGDEHVTKILQDASKHMALCLDMILKIIAPIDLIIDSDWLSQFDRYYFSILNATYKNSSFFRRSDVRISLNSLKDTDILGSGTLVLDSILSDVEDNIVLEMIAIKKAE